MAARLFRSDKKFAPIQTAVLDGFGNMIHADIAAAVKVCNRARDLEDAVVGPGGKPELVDGRFQQVAAGRIDGAVTLDLAAAHLGVTVNL